ncbi:MAG: sigma-54 dependent transcriptional regulator [Acidobacteriota bacterium]
MAKVLIVDDEPQIRRILSVMLTDHGYDVSEAESGEQAIRIQVDFNAAVVLLDLNMPGMDGIATLRALIAQNSTVHCIMMTAYGAIRSAVEAIRIGAFDYLTKPFDNDELLLNIERAIEARRLAWEVEDLRAEISTRYGFNEIVGISPRLQAIFRTVSKVAPVDATVLIEGESGTGKELIARAIHRRSSRGQGPFIAVNCGAIPQSLFEVEFFGCDKGAFTDARVSRAGRFEQAQGGILFLDEIGELPVETQVKLLRALQDHQITRLGGSAPITVNVRVIAATNIDLGGAVGHGKFREDLFWRLNVVRVSLPSLRQRREDIPLLVDHFLDRFNREFGLSIKSIAGDARRLLEMYDWPGNVRELENAVCSAMIMCEGGIVKASDLPFRIRGEADALADSASSKRTNDITKLTLTDAVKEASEKLEKIMIVSRLSEMDGNRTATAESLGISRKTLFNKMRQYGLADDGIEDSL